MEIIVIRSLSFLDLQTEASIERFFSWTADPKIPLSGLAHLDHPLFHGASARHDAVDFQAALHRHGFRTRRDRSRRQSRQPISFRWHSLARHSVILLHEASLFSRRACPARSKLRG